MLHSHEQSPCATLCCSSADQPRNDAAEATCAKADGRFLLATGVLANDDDDDDDDDDEPDDDDDDDLSLIHI